MYRIIACDLDETLLNDEKQISEQDRLAIDEARNKGVYFVFATGRGYKTFQHTLKELNLFNLANEYAISFNGGVLTENNQNHILRFNGLSYETALRLWEIGLSYPVCLHIYTTDTVYLYNCNQDEWNYLNGRMDGCVELENPDISFLKDTPVVKLLYQNLDKKLLQEIETVVRAELPALSFSYSSNRYLEFNKQGIDKGYGLQELAKLLHVPMEETIAIGDNINDIPMLQAAGLGCAVANALPEVQEIADYCCKNDNNHSAIAEIIRHFVRTE